MTDLKKIVARIVYELDCAGLLVKDRQVLDDGHVEAARRVVAKVLGARLGESGERDSDGQ